MISKSNPDVQTVAAKEIALLELGGHELNPYFSVATSTQAEIVLNEHRYLLTPHDEKYDRYQHVLADAHLPAVEAEPDLSDDDVVVAEIPRDARSLPQFAYSYQPEDSFNAQAAVRMIGSAVRRLQDDAHVLPNPNQFSLERTLITRREPGVLLVPPLEFVDSTQETKDQLIAKVREDLAERYKNFGGAALADAFEAGLHS